MGLGQRFAPGDRLLHVPDLPQPEAGDQFLRCGKRPVSDGSTRPVEPNALAMGRGLQAIAGAQDSGVDQLLVE